MKISGRRSGEKHIIGSKKMNKKRIVKMKIFNLHILSDRQLNKVLKTTIDESFTAAQKLDDRIQWAVINPVVHSLKELRKNTWDKDRCDKAIEWLKANFEVEDDEN